MPTNDKKSHGDSSINDRVGIVIYCNNNGQRVIQTIHSIVNQDYKNVAVVVIDDGSTDSSCELIKSSLTDIKSERLEDRESYTLGMFENTHVVLISHTDTEGEIASYNKGLVALWQTVKFIIMANAGDLYYSDKISKFLGVMKSDDMIGVVYSDMIAESGFRCLLPAYDKTLLKTTNYIPSSSMIRKSFIEECGIIKDSIHKFILKIADKAMIVHIPEVYQEEASYE